MHHAHSKFSFCNCFYFRFCFANLVVTHCTMLEATCGLKMYTYTTCRLHRYRKYYFVVNLILSLGAKSCECRRAAIVRWDGVQRLKIGFSEIQVLYDCTFSALSCDDVNCELTLTQLLQILVYTVQLPSSCCLFVVQLSPSCCLFAVQLSPSCCLFAVQLSSSCCQSRYNCHPAAAAVCLQYSCQSEQCAGCSRQFSMLWRRHHCRVCGVAVCASKTCSSKDLLLFVPDAAAAARRRGSSISGAGAHVHV